MRFALTDEQRALQDAVGAYLRDKVGTSLARTMYDDPTADRAPAEVWSALGAQGWLAVMVPEEHGGIGLGLLDAAVLARGFGAAILPAPWLSTVLLGEALRLAGSPEQQAALLPRLAEGEVRGAAALLRPGGTPDVAGAPLATTAGTLTGTLPLVEHGDTAERVLVAGRDGSLALLDPRSPGVTVRVHDGLDRSTRVVTLDLDGAPAEPLPGASPAVVERLLSVGAVLVANELAGLARRTLALTVDYDTTRVQFGKPVGSFQAVKHELADLHLAITFAEHAGYYAAHAADIDAPDAAQAVSIAKAKASDAAADAVGAMLQFHGGIGYTWEHDTHLFFKRAKRLQYAYGDASAHRERLAALVLA